MMRLLFWTMIGNIGRYLTEASDRRLVDVCLIDEIKEKYL